MTLRLALLCLSLLLIPASLGCRVCASPAAPNLCGAPPKESVEQRAQYALPSVDHTIAR